ncbi:MAG: cysteine hydrolase family protein [Ornithinimicrobium sp.]
MIPRFGQESALLLIDVQRGVDELGYWGGADGRRNNPAAEENLAELLDGWRSAGRRPAWTRHDSRQADSPLRLSLPSGRQKPGFEIREGELAVVKDVNSGFVGTSLELQLRRAGVTRLVVGGFFTNMCVETTARMAGNMGFDTYLVHDACATTNRVGPDGQDHDPKLLHAVSVANVHAEFATAITTSDALGLLGQDAEDLERRQGNE